MGLRSRDVALAAPFVLIAWGYASSWMPSIQFIPHAFFLGATAAMLFLLYLAVMTTLSLPSATYDRSYRKRLLFSSRTMWKKETSHLQDRGHYRAAKLLPGTPEISAELDAFLKAIISNFVQSWYSKISSNSAFTNEVDRALRDLLRGVLERLESQDVVDIGILRILPIVTDHFHEFDIAERAVKGRRLNRQVTETAQLDSAIASRYRDGKLHSATSLTNVTSQSGKQDHLRRAVSRLLKAYLPEKLRRCAAVFALMREIVACAVLLPIVNSLSEPDTWNRIVEDFARKLLEERKTVRRIRDALDEHTSFRPVPGHTDGPELTFPKLLPHDNEKRFERFIRAIRKCNNLSDARRFRSEVASQLRKESAIEGQDSLFLRRLETGKHMLDQKIAQLGAGTIRKPPRLRHRPRAGSKLSARPAKSPTGLPGLFDYSTSEPPPKSALENASLEEVLNNASGLSAFMEYMDRLGLMFLVQFWLVVNGLRNPLEMASSNIHENSIHQWTSADRADLAQIKEAYLGQPELKASPELIRTINLFLKEGNSATTAQYRAARQAIFTVQLSVYTRMERDHFPRFKKSDLWFKFLSSDEAAARSKTSRLGLSSVSSSHLNVQDSVSTSTPRDLSHSRSRLGTFSQDKWLAPEDGDMTGSVLSADSDSCRSPALGEPPENTKIVDAVQAALTNILEEGNRHRKSREDRQDKERDESGAGPRPNLASLGLVPKADGGSFLDDLFEDEDGMHLPEHLVDESEGESVDDEIHEAAPGDLGLAEAIDGLTLEIEKLVAQESIVASMIDRAGLINNAAELRILRKSKNSLEKEIHHKELQRQQYILQESDNGLYGRSSISIDSVVMGHEPDGKEYAMYIIQVEREAGEFMPAAAWVVPRRYSEFHALHKRLRAYFPAVTQLDFPRRQMVLQLQLQRDLLEKRRVGLQKYLRALLEMPAVCRSHDFRSFLSQAAIPGTQRPSGKSVPMSDSVEAKDIISRIYNSVSDGVEGFIGNIPVFDQLSSAGQQLISAATMRSGSGSVSPVNPATRSANPFSTSSTASSTSARDRRSQLHRPPDGPTGTFTAMLDPDTAVEAEAELHAFDSKEPPPLVEPICRAFVELFELNRDANWFRGRAVVVVLQQLLGGTVERKVQTLFKNAVAQDAVAGHLRGLRMRLWPSGDSDGAVSGDGPALMASAHRSEIPAPQPSSSSSSFSFSVQTQQLESSATATASQVSASAPNAVPQPAPPSAPPGPSTEVRTEEQKLNTKREAGLLLSIVLPDLVGGVVGRANAAQAARRIVAVLNNRTLNVHLVMTVLDELLGVVLD